MHRILSTFVILLIELVSLGQSNFGIKANVGVSRISHDYGSINLNSETLYAPSGQIGVFYLKQLKTKSYIGSELLINQIEGRENTNIEFYDWNNAYAGYSNSKYYTHITYLSLPLYYGIKIKNLTLNGGFQFAFCLFSSERTEVSGLIDGEEFTMGNTNKNLNIDKFDFGPRLGFTLFVSEKISFEGVYYYGINNIIKDNIFDLKSKIQQATLGVRYHFNIRNLR